MKVAKVLLIFMSLLICSTSSAQFNFKKISIIPTVGVRTYQDALPGLRRAGEVHYFNTLALGLEVRSKDFPIYLSILKDFNAQYSLTNYQPNFEGRINEYWTDTHYLGHYVFKNQLDVGIGYYFMYRETLLTYFLGKESGVDHYHGLMLSAGRRINNINVEFRTKFTLSGHFDALGMEQHSLIFSYPLDKKQKNTVEKEDNFLSRNFHLHPILGTRFFRITGVTVLDNEEFPPIGIAAAFGVELLYKKYNLSFNLEKDLWISLNGGSFVREAKGLIGSTLIALKYHHQFSNNRHLRFGLGYSFIRDLDKRHLIMSNEKGVQLFVYQVKGIGATLSYELFTNADVELKHTFPILSFDEKLFNPLRFSVGLIYRVE